MLIDITVFASLAYSVIWLAYRLYVSVSMFYAWFTFCRLCFGHSLSSVFVYLLNCHILPFFVRINVVIKEHTYKLFS